MKQSAFVRIGILKHGRILAEGSLAELRQRISLKKLWLCRRRRGERAIARARECGFTHRRYGNDFAFGCQSIWNYKKLSLALMELLLMRSLVSRCGY